MDNRPFLIINGPNLNLLGRREPEVYGRDTLEDIKRDTDSQLSKLGAKTVWFQSNVEGELVGKIQEAMDGKYRAVVINPGAYSHTSIAILDALKALSVPVIEVHLSNTHRREEFRQVKLTAKASTAIMEGLGKDAYFLAVYSQLKIHN